MKVFRLVNAELKKIFLRPTIFIMVAFLVLGCFISLLAFSPDNRNIDSTVSTKGSNVSSIYNNFMDAVSSSEYTTKFDLDNKLQNALSYAQSFTTNDDKLSKLKISANTTLGDYHNMEIALENAANPTEMAESVYYTTAKNTVETFNTSLKQTITYISNFTQSDKYYLKETTLTEITETLNELQNIVSKNTTTGNKKTYETLLKSVRKYDFEQLIDDFINSIKPITISNETYESIKENYYTKAIEVLGTSSDKESIYGSIYNFYIENSTESTQECKDEITNLISDYKAYVNLACENLTSAIKLEIGKDNTDIEMQEFVGYTNYNKLVLSSTLSKNSYIISNKINPRTTLDTMNFGVNSGNETNAWDFICFAMNICSLLIIVFCVIICSKIIAGEQAGGTMKMLAIRPFSRNKILTGKLLATMFFSMIFVVFSFVVSFGIGWAFYGLPGEMMIGVFNGTKVIYAHPIIFCIFLTLSLFLKVFIYVSIATMISVIFRSYTGSSMVSFAIVIITLILNGVLATKSWFKYFPMSNFDIYKYFTTSQTATGFKAIFSSPLIIDTSFVFTFLYAIILIIFLNAISYLVFNKKDIA